MIDIIGIGNRFRMDDGVGLVVLERIEGDLIQLSNVIQPIYGETDYMYALNQIRDGSLVIIIDSSLLGIAPGEVTRMPLEDYMSTRGSSHQLSVQDMLRINKTNKGYIITIEAAQIDYSANLSEQLEKNIEKISIEVFKHIQFILKEENQYA